MCGYGKVWNTRTASPPAWPYNWKGYAVRDLLPCQEDENRPLFFSESRADQRKAAAMCAGCPFLEECKANGANEEYGVWGGVIEWDRPEAKRRARDRRYQERRAEQEAEKRETVYTVDPSRLGPKRLSREEREERNAQIISLRAHGVMHRDIAAQFGLHENMVQRICSASRLGA